MNINKIWKKTLVILLSAAALTAMTYIPWMVRQDSAVSDALYQRGGAPDGEIVILAMDEQALELLGPLPWPRSYMAEVIEFLNSDPEARPAVIGVDVLYVGESGDPDADDWLAEACADAGNVVTAAYGTYGTDYVQTGDDYVMVTNTIVNWEGPFDALADVTETGHINALTDNDGVIRHLRLFEDVPGVGRVKAFSRVLYERYCAYKGTEPGPEPRTNALGDFYLPFTSGPLTYECISLAEVFDGSVTPDQFADRIVLIGPFAAGMQDEYRTSIDHAASMYGVEIHANAIDAYRNGFFPREAKGLTQRLVIFILCALALLFFWDRKVRYAVAGWLAACGLWVVACWLLYQKAGVILHVLWGPLFLTILFVASVAVNYVRAAIEKRRVQNTFGHYIDPAVMKQLLEQGSDALELGGKLYDIAVLFVDIRGFTTMSEALDPPTVVEIINKYLTLTTECVMRNHGTLDKFVGDCTMAFWNAPVAQEDPVYLACCAAMDMVEGSKALGEELMEKYGRTVSFGVGVNWGPAVIGNIGAPKRMDYTAIGDTVNTGARLEANAPGGKILISRAVADALGERAEVTSLGDTIKLKGKAEGFEILTLDKLVRTPDPGNK